MKIKVERLNRADKYTEGKMSIDGVYVCDTLEDTDRGLDKVMPVDRIEREKIYGETAIPTGEYRVTTTVYSPKFGSMQFYKDTCGGKLPRLLSVPGYDGVLIHVGASAENTLGCILVGYKVGDGKLQSGKAAFRKLWNAIGKQRDLTIEIS